MTGRSKSSSVISTSGVPLHVPVRDQVEGDVDPSGLCGHSVGVLVDSPLVERIDLRRLDDASRGADLLRHLLEPRQSATGEKDVCPSRAKARATAPPIDPPPP